VGLDERVAALRADRQRGASELADEALAALADAARGAPPGGAAAALRGAARALAGARPTMAVLANRVHEALDGLQGRDDAALRALVPARCEEVRARARKEREEAARVAAVQPLGATVLTLSRSSTVARALTLAHAASPRRVLLPAGEPLRDGLAQARALAIAGLEVEVVPDAALGRAALDGDSALVGADALLPDGTVVNRAGTSLAALAIALARRPCWVVAETAKVTWRSALPLEEGPPGQVWAPGPLLPVRVRNPLFDATPAALVRGYCTELGVLARGDLAGLAEEHRRRAERAMP
jgi:translation initiation factor 2B subunit (eIF-2B alpha/beta/delta family)